jgi:hypothetical protein
MSFFPPNVATEKKITRVYYTALAKSFKENVSLYFEIDPKNTEARSKCLDAIRTLMFSTLDSVGLDFISEQQKCEEISAHAKKLFLYFTTASPTEKAATEKCIFNDLFLCKFFFETSYMIENYLVPICDIWEDENKRLQYLLSARKYSLHTLRTLGFELSPQEAEQLFEQIKWILFYHMMAVAPANCASLTSIESDEKKGV